MKWQSQEDRKRGPGKTDVECGSAVPVRQAADQFIRCPHTEVILLSSLLQRMREGMHSECWSVGHKKKFKPKGLSFCWHAAAAVEVLLVGPTESVALAVPLVTIVFTAPCACAVATIAETGLDLGSHPRAFLQNHPPQQPLHCWTQLHRCLAAIL